MVGQYFVLNCDTNNAQYFQWMKNGYALQGACQAKLVFHAFTASDEGRYSCKVTLCNGHVKTTNIVHLQMCKFSVFIAIVIFIKDEKP